MTTGEASGTLTQPPTRLDKPRRSVYYPGMHDIDYVSLGMRWLHILAVATAVGGTIFMRFALSPSVDPLAQDQRQTLMAGIRSRWAKLVMLSITVLLVSGLVSYFTIRGQFIAAGPEGKLPALFNMLFGIKFLLALGIFFIASALSGRSRAFERFRENSRFWMTVNLVLAVLVICISGVLRSMHSYPNPARPEVRVSVASCEPLVTSS